MCSAYNIGFTTSAIWFRSNAESAQKISEGWVNIWEVCENEEWVKMMGVTKNDDSGKTKTDQALAAR